MKPHMSGKETFKTMQWKEGEKKKKQAAACDISAKAADAPRFP